MNLFKKLLGNIFSILFRASHNQILDKKNHTKFFVEAFRSEIRFHNKPGLSQPSFEQPGHGEARTSDSHSYIDNKINEIITRRNFYTHS